MVRKVVNVRGELTHTGPKDADREAELRQPSGVVCSDLIRRHGFFGKLGGSGRSQGFFVPVIKQKKVTKPKIKHQTIHTTEQSEKNNNMGIQLSIHLQNCNEVIGIGAGGS